MQPYAIFQAPPGGQQQAWHYYYCVFTVRFTEGNPDSDWQALSAPDSHNSDTATLLPCGCLLQVVPRGGGDGA